MSLRIGVEHSHLTGLKHYLTALIPHCFFYSIHVSVILYLIKRFDEFTTFWEGLVSSLDLYWWRWWCMLVDRVLTTLSFGKRLCVLLWSGGGSFSWLHFFYFGYTYISYYLPSTACIDKIKYSLWFIVIILWHFIKKHYTFPLYCICLPPANCVSSYFS